MTNNLIPSHIQQTIAKTENHPLADFAIIFEQVVAWGDMDAFNHVNNVRYYDYAQSARIHFMQQLAMFGGTNGNEKEQGSAAVVTILAASSCQYLRPVTFPDTLWIGVRAKKVGNTSLVQEYGYFSTAQNAVVATGEAVLVLFESDGMTKRAFTEAEKQKFVALEQ